MSKHFDFDAFDDRIAECLRVNEYIRTPDSNLICEAIDQMAERASSTIPKVTQ